MESIPFADLEQADLIVDCTYHGGKLGNAGDDPFPRLLGLSNMGGFRYRGSLKRLEMLVLTSSLRDSDWPDSLDHDTGIFTYYGDNKTAGRALHDTPRKGNEILRRLFDSSASRGDGRAHVPPIFVFANSGCGRDVIFLGLAVPGTMDSRASEDLVAVWKAIGKRFQNYRARFTILDVPVVSRAWIRDINAGHPRSANAPAAWVSWVEGRHARALMAKRSVEHRTKSEQLPSSEEGKRLIAAMHSYFAERPHDFEACAATLTRMLLPDITSLDLTRPSRDGGRDATGELRIGSGRTSIDVVFALEAKCYGPSNGVGVREMSRLISRLRHRQFGVLVTTSYVDAQAYREIKEDGHPVIIMSGQDIVDLLRESGRGTPHSVRSWLEQEFPNDDFDSASR